MVQGSDLKANYFYEIMVFSRPQHTPAFRQVHYGNVVVQSNEVQGFSTVVWICFRCRLWINFCQCCMLSTWHIGSDLPNLENCSRRLSLVNCTVQSYVSQLFGHFLHTPAEKTISYDSSNLFQPSLNANTIVPLPFSKEICRVILHSIRTQEGVGGWRYCSSTYLHTPTPAPSRCTSWSTSGQIYCLERWVRSWGRVNWRFCAVFEMFHVAFPGKNKSVIFVGLKIANLFCPLFYDTSHFDCQFQLFLRGERKPTPRRWRRNWMPSTMIFPSPFLRHHCWYHFSHRLSPFITATHHEENHSSHQSANESFWLIYLRNYDPIDNRSTCWPSAFDKHEKGK